MFNDLYVDTDGLIYVTDRIKGGLYVLEYTGPENSMMFIPSPAPRNFGNKFNVRKKCLPP